MPAVEVMEEVQSSMEAYLLSRNPELREQVAADSQPLVKWVVGSWISYVPDSSWDDALSEGNVALARAIEKYDGRAKFSTFASLCIFRQVFWYLRKQNDLPKPVSLSAPVYDDKALVDILPAKNEEYSHQLSDFVHIALSGLTERERQVIELRYGLNGNQIHYLKDVGEKFNCSHEMVRRIQNKALSKLRFACLEFLVTSSSELP